MRALFPKNVNAAKWPNLVVIIINKATFAKRAYVGKIIYWVWPFSQTGLIPGMVGMGVVVVRI